jgi:predicted nucleic acid-binding protein
MRFVLDSNIYDHLIETPELQRQVIDAHQRGEVEFLMTSIQLDEITEVPDGTRRNAMAAIPFVVTPTYGIVLGLSKPGLARFGESEQLDAIRSQHRNHSEDALLATTAKYEEAVLVTEDQRLAKRARELGVEVWGAKRLVELMVSLSSGSD